METLLNFFQGEDKQKRIVLVFVGILVLIILPLSLIFIRTSFNTIGPAPSNLISPTPFEGIRTIELPAVLPTMSIEPPVGISSDVASNVIINFPDQSFPPSATVYKKTVINLTDNEIQTIGDNFGFQSDPIITTDGRGYTIYLWNENNKSLTVNKNIGEIQYFNKDSNNQTKIINSPQQAVDSATDFLVQNKLSHDDVKPSLQDVQFLIQTNEDADMHRAANFSEANIYLIPFIRKLKDRTVYHQGASNAQIQVFVSSNNHIQNFYYLYPFVSMGESNYTLLNLSEIKEKLQKGEGRIARIGPQYEFTLGEQPNSPITLTTATLVYFDTGTNEYIYPVFLFEGTFINTEGTEEKIVVFLPAIRT